MKKIIRNKTFICLLVIILTFILLWYINYLDRKRCENNGGTYIWEFTYGTKCHFK